MVEVIIKRGETTGLFGKMKDLVDKLEAEKIDYSKVTMDLMGKSVTWFEIEFPKKIKVQFPGHLIDNPRFYGYLKGILHMINFMNSIENISFVWKDSYCYIPIEDEKSAEDLGNVIIREALRKGLAVFAGWGEEPIFLKEKFEKCDVRGDSYLCRFKSLSIDCGYPDLEGIYGISFNLLIVSKDDINRLLKAIVEGLV